MKNILTIGISVLITSSVLAQTESKTDTLFEDSKIIIDTLVNDPNEIEQLENKINSISDTKEELINQSQAINSSDIFERIKLQNEALIQLLSSPIENDELIRQKQTEIEELKNQLEQVAFLEKKITDLTNSLSSVTNELIDLRRFKANSVAEKQRIDNLLAKNEDQYNTTIRFEITKFLGIIEGWTSLSGSFKGLAETSEAVLIFDQKTGQKIGNFLKKQGFDILTISSGVISLNGFQNNKETEGLIYAGLGVALKSVQSVVDDNNIVESITRNVAFADEIRAYAKLSNDLDSRVSKLSEKIPTTPAEQQTWFPERKEIDQYENVINLLDQIQLQNLLIKNKAEFLLESGKQDETLSPEGKKFLVRIKESMQGAMDTWSIFKPSHTNRIKLFYDDLKKRENAGL